MTFSDGDRQCDDLDYVLYASTAHQSRLPQCVCAGGLVKEIAHTLAKRLCGYG